MFKAVLEDLAGNVLGTLVGTDAGAYLKNKLEGTENKAIDPSGTQSQPQATPNTDRYALPDSEAKRTNTSQWSNVQNVQNNYITNSAAVSGEIDDEFAQAISIANPVSQNPVMAAQTQSQLVAQQQAQAGMRAVSTTPFASNFMGLRQDFATNFKNNMTDPMAWAEATVDHIRESATGKMIINDILPDTKEMYLRARSDVILAYNRMSAYADGDNYFNQSIYRDALSSDIKDMFANGLKYGGASLLSNAGSIFTLGAAGKATYDVYKASPSQAGWVAVKEYGAIGAGAFGAGVVSVVGAPVELVGAVVAGAIDITVNVVGASMGSSIWMTSVDKIHQYVDPSVEGWSNRP